MIHCSYEVRQARRYEKTKTINTQNAVLIGNEKSGASSNSIIPENAALVTHLIEDQRQCPPRSRRLNQE